MFRISIHCNKSTVRWMQFLHLGITDRYCRYNQPREGSMDTQIYILGNFFQLVIHWDKNAHMQIKKNNKTCLNFLNDKTFPFPATKKGQLIDLLLFIQKKPSNNCDESRRNDGRGYHFWSFSFFFIKNTHLNVMVQL